MTKLFLNSVKHLQLGKDCEYNKYIYGLSISSAMKSLSRKRI